ncbi:MAG: hypothetical protein KJ876_13080, partial [Alphaproteobacteria bacterium]|nr:hypothetical protein [Alphaproteobacteria bacterium]
SAPFFIWRMFAPSKSSPASGGGPAQPVEGCRPIDAAHLLRLRNHNRRKANSCVGINQILA